MTPNINGATSLPESSQVGQSQTRPVPTGSADTESYWGKQLSQAGSATFQFDPAGRQRGPDR